MDVNLIHKGEIAHTYAQSHREALPRKSERIMLDGKEYRVDKVTHIMATSKCLDNEVEIVIETTACM